MLSKERHQTVTGPDSYAFAFARTELAACDFKASGMQCATDTVL